MNINIRQCFVIAAAMIGLGGSMLHGMDYLRGLSYNPLMEKLCSHKYQMGGIILAGAVLYGGYRLWRDLSSGANIYNIEYTTTNVIDSNITTYDINVTAQPKILKQEKIRTIDWATKHGNGYKALLQFVTAHIMPMLKQGQGVTVRLTEDHTSHFCGSCVTLTQVMDGLNSLLTTMATSRQRLHQNSTGLFLL